MNKASRLLILFRRLSPDRRLILLWVLWGVLSTLIPLIGMALHALVSMGFGQGAVDSTLSMLVSTSVLLGSITKTFGLELGIVAWFAFRRPHGLRSILVPIAVSVTAVVASALFSLAVGTIWLAFVDLLANVLDVAISWFIRLPRLVLVGATLYVFSQISGYQLVRRAKDPIASCLTIKKVFVVMLVVASVLALTPEISSRSALFVGVAGLGVPFWGIANAVPWIAVVWTEFRSSWQVKLLAMAAAVVAGVLFSLVYFLSISTSFVDPRLSPPGFFQITLGSLANVVSVWLAVRMAEYSGYRVVWADPRTAIPAEQNPLSPNAFS